MVQSLTSNGNSKRVCPKKEELLEHTDISAKGMMDNETGTKVENHRIDW